MRWPRPVDRLVGRATRAGLQFIANNSRFLILPWVHVQIPGQPYSFAHCPPHRADWQKRYDHPLHLLETFVQPDRFRRHLLPGSQLDPGGSNDRPDAPDRRQRINVHAPLKDIYLYPLTAMRAETSVVKSREELLGLGPSPPAPAWSSYTLALQAEVSRLRDVRAQNSRNSSRPPSTDRPETAQTQKPAPKVRTPLRRSAWPPRPHSSTQRQPQHPEVHPLRECPCGEDLSQEPALDFERRQVFDLPSPLGMHRTSGRDQRVPRLRANLAGALSADLNAPVQYGKNFRSCSPTSTMPKPGASLRIRQMGQEMFGFAISEGTLQRPAKSNTMPWSPLKTGWWRSCPKKPVFTPTRPACRSTRSTIGCT